MSTVIQQTKQDIKRERDSVHSLRFAWHQEYGRIDVTRTTESTQTDGRTSSATDLYSTVQTQVESSRVGMSECQPRLSLLLPAGDRFIGAKATELVSWSGKSIQSRQSLNITRSLPSPFHTHTHARARGQLEDV